MAIPKYNEMMLPVLEFLSTRSHGEIVSSKELRAQVVERFSLTEEEVAELLPSGNYERYANNVMWACTYLRQAGLIVSPKRGTYQITERGRELLNEKPESLSRGDLMRYPEFNDFLNRSSKDQRGMGDESRPNDASEADENTPEEIIEEQFRNLNAALEDELLSLVLEQTPARFERLVVNLLLAMGYGDVKDDSGEVTPLSNDKGIDGIVREDKLGFSNVYIQAKRWGLDEKVGRPELQAFVGALMGANATKGLFITTARFSDAAKEYAKTQHAVSLVLVDGSELAKLMITHDVGVSVRHTYEVKSIDSDYFDE